MGFRGIECHKLPCYNEHMNLEHLTVESLALDFSARKELAYLLLDSLIPEEPGSLHPAWKTELDRRWAEIEKGKELFDAEAVECELAVKHGISL